jgi:uncharacterized membrane protein YeaQ/YmgE (transglycosylase-associated protein family)
MVVNMHRLGIAIAAGVIAFIVLEFLSLRSAEYIYECCTDSNGDVPPWYAMASSPFRALVSLVPGFIAGWLAPRRGILAGFLAGLIGYFIYSAIFFTYWSAVLEGGPSGVIEVLLQTVVSALSWGLSAAAAGGTAQLLRSKTAAG